MRRGGQGEALAVWAVWLLTLLAVVVTYSRIDAPSSTTSRATGLGLGLSRAAVHTNWPFALVAIVLVLVAMRRPAAARLVDRGAGDRALRDDATCSSASRTSTRAGRTSFRASASHSRSDWPSLRCGGLGASFQPRLPGDPRADRRRGGRARPVASLDRRGARLPPAGRRVHGAGALPHRRRAARGGGAPRRAPRVARRADCCSRRSSSRGCRPSVGSGSGSSSATSALAAYGAVNATQDFWQEQLVKRGTVDWAIPSALYPGSEAGDARHRSAGRARGLAAERSTRFAREQAILRA